MDQIGTPGEGTRPTRGRFCGGVGRVPLSLTEIDPALLTKSVPPPEGGWVTVFEHGCRQTGEPVVPDERVGSPLGA